MSNCPSTSSSIYNYNKELPHFIVTKEGLSKKYTQLSVKLKKLTDPPSTNIQDTIHVLDKPMILIMVNCFFYELLIVKGCMRRYICPFLSDNSYSL